MTPEHPFAATLAVMHKKPEEGGGYARLNEQQRWEWHADVYAFRRVVLSVMDAETTSPCDPDGKWFNPHLVGIAERYRRAKAAEQSRVCRLSTETANAIRFADAERWRQSAEGKAHLAGSRRSLAAAE